MFTLRAPTKSYNLCVFVPLLLAFALQALAQSHNPTATASSSSTTARWRPQWTPYAVYGVLCALMAVGFARQVAIFEVFRRQGVTCEQARQRLRQLLPAGNHPPIVFDSALLPLLPDYERVYQELYVEPLGLQPIPGTEKPLLLVHQWYNRYEVAPVVPGYELVESNFVKQAAPSFLGIRVGRVMPGYAFALYRPLPSAAP